MEFYAWVGLSNSDDIYYERRVIVRFDKDDLKEFLRQLEAAQNGVRPAVLCTCKLPGFDTNQPAICPTCGKPHRRTPPTGTP